MSATGTAIEMQRGRPRGAILMSSVLAATLGIGFFAGRAMDAAPTTEPEGVSVIAPEIGAHGIGYRPEGFKPHVPKRGATSESTSGATTSGSTSDGTIEGSNHHLPARWHMN